MGFLKGLCKFLLGTMVILALGEGVLRLSGYAGVERYLPDPDLFWRLTPNQKAYTKVGHFPVRTNSMGMRSPEVDCEKPAGTMRVMVFGDSFTFGWGVRQEETYAAQLQQLFRAALPNRSVEVWNAGCNAYNVYQEVAYLRKLVACKPDVVVISCTFNDGMIPDVSKMTEQDRERIRKGVALKNLVRRFALYNFVVEAKGKAVYFKIRSKIIGGSWGTEVPGEEQQVRMAGVLRDAEQICRENGIKLVFLVTSGGQKEPGPYQQCMIDVATQDGVPLVNMVARLHDSERGQYWIPDGHFNAAGHAATAQALFEQLKGETWPAS